MDRCDSRRAGTWAIATVICVLAVAGMSASTGSRPSPVLAAAPQGGLPAGLQLKFVKVAEDLADPVLVTHAGDGSGRLFVVEQIGRIRIVKVGRAGAPVFLDIQSRLVSGGEQGLLGLAFPPNYSTKKYFYVNYTDRSGDTVISRFHTTANPDVADPNSEEILLTINQPFSNHNGGHIAFGKDGYLYIGMGDGGSANDPGNRAQDRGVLLGKFLRIDTESGEEPYGIPPDNPFVNRENIRPEIWSLGWRNPWRWSFDRETGDLYIGDVGQDQWEEVNFEANSSEGGENYGWRIMEGNQCFQNDGCNQQGLTKPVFVYSHRLGIAVVGGYVYRGKASPRMKGVYFCADYGSGRVWALARDGSRWENRQIADTRFTISSFGEDEAGELYITTLDGNSVYRLVDAGRSDRTPDLVPSWKLAQRKPADCEPEVIKGKVKVKNAGKATSAKTSVSILRSADNVPGEDDVLLTELQLGTLKKRRSKVLSFRVQLPLGDSAQGQHLLAITDPDNLVSESNEENNTAASQALK